AGWRTSTPWSPATPWTRTSPRTGSGSWPSRAMPTPSWMPRTSPRPKPAEQLRLSGDQEHLDTQGFLSPRTREGSCPAGGHPPLTMLGPAAGRGALWADAARLDGANSAQGDVCAIGGLRGECPEDRVTHGGQIVGGIRPGAGALGRGLLIRLGAGVDLVPGDPGSDVLDTRLRLELHTERAADPEGLERVLVRAGEPDGPFGQLGDRITVRRRQEDIAAHAGDHATQHGVGGGVRTHANRDEA